MNDQPKVGQRVTAKPGTEMYLKGCRVGEVYYVGETLIAVEFDYMETVAALLPSDIEPV